MSDEQEPDPDQTPAPRVRQTTMIRRNLDERVDNGATKSHDFGEHRVPRDGNSGRDRGRDEPADE